MDVCPSCECPLNVTSNRLIEETCGHKKCRECFIRERVGCKSCQNDNPQVGLNKCQEVSYKVLERNDNGQLATNTKKFNGQLKLKTEWAILSKTANIHHPCKKNEEPDTEFSQKMHEEPFKSSALNNIANFQESSDTVRDVKNHKRISEKNNAKSRAKIILPSHIESLRDKDQVVYKCVVCNSIFKFKYHYRYHDHCPTGAKPFKCEYCLKTFRILAHLKYHSKSHVDGFLHQCTDCGKTFTETGSLNRHMKTHSKTRSFGCKFCAENFATAATLSAHVLRHSNEKPFICQICQKKFNDRSNFRKHMLIHNTPNKEFLCEICGKSFKLHWSLKAHRLSHSRIKSHKCCKCNSNFADMHSLKRHFSSHTDHKKFSCVYCKTKCRRRDNLERHIRNTHPEKRGDSMNDLNCGISLNSNDRRSTRKEIMNAENATICNDKIILIKEDLNKSKEEGDAQANVTQNSAAISSLKDIQLNKNDLVIQKEMKPFGEENFRIPVINGPIKLSLKNMQHSAKQNLYRNIDTRKCEDLHLDICRKILQAPASKFPSTQYKNKNSTLEACQIPEINLRPTECSNMIKKNNQEYHIELYRKILMPSYVPEHKNEDQIDNHVSTITMISGNKIMHS